MKYLAVWHRFSSLRRNGAFLFPRPSLPSTHRRWIKGRALGVLVADRCNFGPAEEVSRSQVPRGRATRGSKPFGGSAGLLSPSSSPAVMVSSSCQQPELEAGPEKCVWNYM